MCVWVHVNIKVRNFYKQYQLILQLNVNGFTSMEMDNIVLNLEFGTRLRVLLLGNNEKVIAKRKPSDR